MSHTPGPWKQERALYRYYEITREGYWVARTRGAENARLIASAPILLEALKAVTLELHYCSQQLCESGWTEGSTVRNALSNARAAIAKATGEQK